MSLNKEWINKLNEKDKAMESYKYELKFLRISIIREKIKRKKERVRKFVGKKIIERKRHEAFPRKGGNYNELFQDFGKESWTHNNPTQTG